MGRTTPRVAAAVAALGLAMTAPPLVAQSGQVEGFDLPPSATPAPEPPVIGPDDPENPSGRPRPLPSPSSEAPAAVPSVPEATSPSPGPSADLPPEAIAGAPEQAAAPAALPNAPPPSPADVPAPPSEIASEPPGAALGERTEPALPSAPGPASAYVPRSLGVVDEPGSMLYWVLGALLGALAAAGAWLAWSRHFRDRARPMPAPEIERPRHRPQTPRAADPVGVAPAPPALALSLQATRMSATLVNAALSYRLVVTNNGPEPLRALSVAGDMIAAHASRPAEDLLGPGGAGLPELHRLEALAPGESAEFSGDIRLPLVAITPIRRGNAALFVPLARFRARGTAADGAPVEGGGTFLVGQEPTTNARLQPFRLDLGPRNYSRLGQHLLPAPA